MAAAVLVAGVLHAILAPQLRVINFPGVLLAFFLLLLAVVILADPGRIDRESSWSRIATGILIAAISLSTAWATVLLIHDILDGSKFFSNAGALLRNGGALWLANVIGFALWYWDLDRGGAAARARHPDALPDFVFPEMTNQELVRAGWYPKFVDYLHLSFHTATAFSPTDVSAIRPWAKMLMIAESRYLWCLRCW